MAGAPKHILWIDLEATGSRTEDPILEIGCTLTLAASPWLEIDTFERVVRPEVGWESLMNETVLKMHTENGLIVDVAERGIPLSEAEADLIGWLKSHGLRKHEFVVAGVGVSYYDWRLIDHQMPKFRKWPQHPKFDIGSWRAGLRFAGRSGFVTKGLTYDVEATHMGKPHRALADIRDHLAEWRVYGFLVQAILPEQGIRAVRDAREMHATSTHLLESPAEPPG